jgi:hypothetical protein
MPSHEKAEQRQHLRAAAMRAEKSRVRWQQDTPGRREYVSVRVASMFHACRPRPDVRPCPRSVTNRATVSNIS